MPKKEFTIVNELLFWLSTLEDITSAFLMTPYEWKRRALFGKNYASYKSSVYQLKRRGLVNIISKDGKKFLKLTAKGGLEVLLAKAKISNPGKWDGKWRLVIFDIPEDAKNERGRLRDLLKKNNFYKLQASVYINPYSLNREAIAYLKQTGLIKFIRLLKVEELDDDKDLRKKFDLK